MHVFTVQQNLIVCMYTYNYGHHREPTLCSFCMKPEVKWLPMTSHYKWSENCNFSTNYWWLCNMILSRCSLSSTTWRGKVHSINKYHTVSEKLEGMLIIIIIMFISSYVSLKDSNKLIMIFWCKLVHIAWFGRRYIVTWIHNYVIR